MPNIGARLILSGCAALAFGFAVGWAVQAFRPVSAENTPADVPARQSSPPILNAAEAPALTRPLASAIAPAAPTPPTPTIETARPRESGARASGPTGIWIDHTGRGAVEISECAGRLCGRIVWLKDAGHGSVCGTQVIGNAKRTAAGTWDGGWIYDPEKEQRYSVELKPVGADKLRVIGYLGSKFFSQTFTWKRPTAELERCDAPASAAIPSPQPTSDQKSASTAVEAEPSPTVQNEASQRPPTRKSPKPADWNIAAFEKMAREMGELEWRDVKRKSGRRECSARVPYVGTITVPCP
jgi:uncharacterized protein (DUF2147 family)